MNFDYMSRVVVDANLEIEEIGNCAIEAFNDSGEEFILIIKTIMGITEIVQFGGIVPDMQELPKSVSYTYSRIPYAENRVATTIKKFLNGVSKGITQARLVDFDEAKSVIRNIVEYTNI